MGPIRWENPPAEHGNAKPPKPLKYQPLVDALKARQGEWALIVDRRTQGSAGGLAHCIRNGPAPWLPVGAFEAKVVGPAGGPSKVYARFVGLPAGPTTEDGDA